MARRRVGMVMTVTTTALAFVLCIAVTLLPQYARAHMKLQEPPARNQPNNLASASCCAASTKATPRINNFQCEMGDPKTTTRRSATGKIMYEGRGYSLQVHLAVNHLGKVFHGIEDYSNPFPSSAPVSTYLSLTDQSITNATPGSYTVQQPYVLTLGTACTNCGWWSWYDTQSATGGPMATSWTSCADITVLPVDFPLYYSTTADATGANTMFSATTPPTMTGQFYVNTPMPDVLQEGGTTLPANENEIANVRYTLLCPTGVTSPQCDTTQTDATIRPFGTTTPYDADTLPNGQYTVTSDVYFKLRDRAGVDLNRYRTYTATFIVLRDLDCGNPSQQETGTPTPYACPAATHVPKTAAPATLNCGTTACSTSVCCDPRQTCTQFIAADTPGCTPGVNTPTTTAATTVCTGATCAVAECCVPNGVCGDYTCPPTHVRPIPNVATTVCSQLVCTPTECCQPNMQCSQYACEAQGLYHPTPGLPLSTTCNDGGVCTVTDCCTANQQCSDVSLCVPGTTTPRPEPPASITCAAATCVVTDCCVPNQRCGAYACPSATHARPIPGENARVCTALACTPAECCLPNETCAAYVCQAGLYHPTPGLPLTTVCTNNGVCTTGDCCTPNPRCDAYVCPPEAIQKVDNAADVICAAAACVQSECCGDNQRCSDAIGICVAGATTMKPVDPATILCAGAECVVSDCCDPNPLCATYTCPAEAVRPRGDGTQVCTTNTCTTLQCCVPNDVCGGGGGVDGAAAAYVCPSATHARMLANAASKTCAAATCVTDECCQPNEICDTYVCQAGLYHPTPGLPLTTVCTNNGVCDAATCCTPNQRCDTYNCPPSAITKVDNPSSVVCSNAACEQNECCGDNQRCSAVSLCINGVTHMKPEDPAAIQCVAAECVVADCCLPNPVCSSMTCPPDAVQSIADADTTVCTSDQCDAAQCCVPNPMCTTYVCPGGMTLDAGADRIRCVGTTCTARECCFDNQRCDAFAGCRQGTMSPLETVAAADIVCAAALCSSQDCCRPNPRCDGYSCPPMMVRPVATPADVVCTLAGGPGSGCLDTECCLPNDLCASHTCAGIYQDVSDKATRVCDGVDGTCTDERCCSLIPTCGNRMGVAADVADALPFDCGRRAKVDNFDITACDVVGCAMDTCCVAVAGIVPVAGPVTLGEPAVPVRGGVLIVEPDGTTTTVGRNPTGPLPSPTQPTLVTRTTVVDDTTLTAVDPPIDDGSTTPPSERGTQPGPETIGGGAGGSKDTDDDTNLVVGVIAAALLLCCLLLLGLLYRRRRRGSSDLFQLQEYRDVAAHAANDTGLKGVGRLSPCVSSDEEEEPQLSQVIVGSDSSSSDEKPTSEESSSEEEEVESSSSSSEEEEEEEQEAQAQGPQRPTGAAPQLQKRGSVVPKLAAPVLKKKKKKPKTPAPLLKRGPRMSAPVLQRKVIVAAGTGGASPSGAGPVCVGAGGGGGGAVDAMSHAVGAGGGGGDAAVTASAAIGAGGGSGDSAVVVPVAPKLKPRAASVSVPHGGARRRSTMRRGGRAGPGGRRGSQMYKLHEVKQINTPVVNTVVSVMGQEFKDLVENLAARRSSTSSAAGTAPSSAAPSRRSSIMTSSKIEE